MKCIFALLALTLVPFTVAAQQPASNIPPPPRPTVPDGGKCNPDNQRACEELARELHAYEIALEAWQKAYDVWDKANELRKAADDLKKAQSSDQGQQIDGVIGLGKDANSNGNNNAASKAVTDKALDFMGQYAQQEKALLENVGKTVEQGSGEKAGSPSSLSSGTHQLVESTKGSGGQVTFDQQFEKQQEILLVSPSSSKAERHQPNPSTISRGQVTFDQQFEKQQGALLASPSRVAKVAKADQQVEAVAQEHRAQKAKEEAEQRAAEAAAVAQAKKDKAAKEAAADAAWEKEYEAEQRAAALAHKRLMQAMGLLPADPPPTYTSPYYSYFSYAGSIDVPSSDDSTTHRSSCTGGEHCVTGTRSARPLDSTGPLDSTPGSSSTPSPTPPPD